MKRLLERIDQHIARLDEHDADGHLWWNKFRDLARDEARKENQTPIYKALDQLVHLHHCEEEGMASGQPAPSEWRAAVAKGVDALLAVDDQTETLTEKID